MHAIIELFEGQEVTFRPDAWINATEVCKRFDKRPAEFLRLPSTKAYIAALARSMKAVWENPIVNDSLRENPAVVEALPDFLVTIQNGGAKPGTWLHPDLGIELARWLSPDFSVWCNQQIRQILTEAATPRGRKTAAVQKDVQRLADRLARLEGGRVHAVIEQALPAEALAPADDFSRDLLALCIAALGTERTVVVLISELAMVARRHSMHDILGDKPDPWRQHVALGVRIGAACPLRWQVANGVISLRAKGRNRHRRYVIERFAIAPEVAAS